MKAIFKVEFECDWKPRPAKGVKGTQPDAYDAPEDVNVLCDGDADAAIAKARKWALNRIDESEDWEDDRGKKHKVTYDCTAFRLQGVKVVAEADI